MSRRATSSTLAQHPKVVGIGEAGLDYHYDFSPREAQAAGFRVHIAAARETGLPLVIHSREAEDDTAAILEEEMARGPSSRCSIASRPRPSLRGAGLRSAPMSPSPASSPTSRQRTSGKLPLKCRSTGCWSKPTRPISRRCLIGARPTSPLCREDAGAARRSQGRLARETWRGQRAPISSGCLPRWRAR